MKAPRGILLGNIIGLAFTLIFNNAYARPVVSGEEMRGFLGNNTGKLIYTKWGDGYNDGRSLWYLDFSEDDLEEHLLIEENDIQPEQASISPDGKHFIYATSSSSSPESKIYICELGSNSQSSRTFVCNGGQPKWWTKKTTSELFMICNDQSHFWGFNLGQWPPPGNTYMMKFDPSTLEPVGSLELLISAYANGCRSPDGGILFTAGRETGTYYIDKDAVSNANVKETIRFSEELGCNPGFSPGGTDDDAMVLHNGAGEQGATLGLPGHTYFVIRRPSGEIIQTHRKDPSDGNPYTESTRWSSHENYTTFCAASGVGSGLHNAYIYRVSDDKELRVLEGNYFWPYLWVDNGNAIKPSGMNNKEGHLAGKGLARKVVSCSPERIANLGNAKIYDLSGRKIMRSPNVNGKTGTGLFRVFVVVPGTDNN
jgi:hypothetical protein